MAAYDSGSGSSSSETQTVPYCIESTVGSGVTQGECTVPAVPQYDPQMNLRAAIPAIEAYYADNGTYAGMTDDLLRANYDAGIPTITLVRANKNTYCVESTVEGVTFHKAGPAKDIASGPC